MKNQLRKFFIIEISIFFWKLFPNACPANYFDAYMFASTLE